MKQRQNVVSIRFGYSLAHDEIVELAFARWRERFGLREGSPRDDFVQARQEILSRAGRTSRDGAGLFLVPRTSS